MAEHETTEHKKREEQVDKKNRLGQQEPQPLFDQSDMWEENIFSVTGTSFMPRMDEHAELLAMARSEEKRGSIMLQLQQAYGNRYAQHLMESIGAQAKLTVSAPDDVYEREADRVADRVHKAAAPKVRRQEQEAEGFSVPEIGRIVPTGGQPELQERKSRKKKTKPAPAGGRSRYEHIKPRGKKAPPVPTKTPPKLEEVKPEEKKAPPVPAKTGGVPSPEIESKEPQAPTGGRSRYEHIKPRGKKAPPVPTKTPPKLEEVKPEEKKAPPVPAKTGEAPSPEVEGKGPPVPTGGPSKLEQIKSSEKKAPPAPTKPEALREEVKKAAPTEAKAPGLAGGPSKLEQTKSGEKKAEPVPKPAEAKSEFEAILSKMEPQRMRAEREKKPIIWNKGELEQQGGTESSGPYVDIGNGLSEYHGMGMETEEQVAARSVKAFELRGLIKDWRKKNRLVRLVPFWKRGRRKALNILEKQLLDEGTRINELREYYDIDVEFKEKCQEVVETDKQPATTVVEIDKKIMDFRANMYNLPTYGPRDLLAEIREKIEERIAQLKEQKEKQQESLSAEGTIKEGEFSEWMEREKKVRGLETTKLEEKSLEFGPMLEALDPGHREAGQLFGRYQEWLKEPTKLPFFKWVTTWELLNKPLKKIRYITDATLRKKYKLGFKGIQPFYAEREPKESKGEKEKKDLKSGIYVMTPDKEFYARRETPERQETFHHSSFLAGLPVGAAGKMDVERGKLNMNLESGHYHPTMRHMANAVEGLAGKGVPLEQIKVSLLDKNDPDNGTMTASDFRAGLKAVKEGKNPVTGSKFAMWLGRLKKKYKKDPKKDPRVVDASKVVS